jgi:hypothetical protein
LNSDRTKTLYLSKLLDVVRDTGCPTDPILDAAGMAACDLQNRELPLPLGTYIAAVEQAVAQCPIPDLGFRVGARTTPLEHGVLGYALLSSPNLRISLDRYVRFQYLQGPLLAVSLSESDTTAALVAVPLRRRSGLSPGALR